MLANPFATALNHLIAQNSWVLQRLARFAGKTARFDVAPFSFAVTILEDGSVRNADTSAESDVVCVIAPSLLPRLALHDTTADAEIRTEGDTELLAEILFLSRNMRWDVVEDLSGFTGDIMAERLSQTARGIQQQAHASVMNFFAASAEYLTEERPLLAKPQQVSAFMQQVDALRDDAARLEQRISRLSSAK